MTTEDLRPMNIALATRLRFIDFMLDHVGHVAPKHLQDYFGIGTAQASRDLKDYLALAPRNAEYDRASKVYWKRQQFTRVLP